MLVVFMNLQWIAMIFPERSQDDITMLLMKYGSNNDKFMIKYKTATEMVFFPNTFCVHHTPSVAENVRNTELCKTSEAETCDKNSLRSDLRGQTLCHS